MAGVDLRPGDDPCTCRADPACPVPLHREHAAQQTHIRRPATTRRDRLYEILRDAGDKGITHREIAEDHGIHCALVHVESLRFEGHGIEILKGHNTRGWAVTKLYLTRDAWADEKQAAA